MHLSGFHLHYGFNRRKLPLTFLNRFLISFNECCHVSNMKRNSYIYDIGLYMRTKSNTKQHIPHSRYVPPAPSAPSHSNQGGFLSNMFTGFALGTGSSIGRNMVDGMMRPTNKTDSNQDSFPQNTKPNSYIKSDCDEEYSQYLRCSENIQNDCDKLYQAYFDCMIREPTLSVRD
jgi:hypothetical protein